MKSDTKTETIQICSAESFIMISTRAGLNELQITQQQLIGKIQRQKSTSLSFQLIQKRESDRNMNLKYSVLFKKKFKSSNQFEIDIKFLTRALIYQTLLLEVSIRVKFQTKVQIKLVKENMLMRD